MSRPKPRQSKVIAFSVALTLVLVSACFLSISPYRLHVGVLPTKESTFYAGSFISIIGDAKGNFTQKHGYALQLWRLQVTYLRLVSF